MALQSIPSFSRKDKGSYGIWQLKHLCYYKQTLQLLQMSVKDCQAAVEKEYEEIAHKKMVNSDQKGRSERAWQIF